MIELIQDNGGRWVAGVAWPDAILKGDLGATPSAQCKTFAAPTAEEAWTRARRWAAEVARHRYGIEAGAFTIEMHGGRLWLVDPQFNRAEVYCLEHQVDFTSATGTGEPVRWIIAIRFYDERTRRHTHHAHGRGETIEAAALDACAMRDRTRSDPVWTALQANLATRGGE